MTTTLADAKRSVATARTHLEAAAAEVLWQVENQAWEALGYPTWDAMREAEYGGVAVMVPSKERPQLTQALRSHGLTQQQIADTVGVSRPTVAGDLSMSTYDIEPHPITNTRGQERPATYVRREPPPVYIAPVPDETGPLTGLTEWSRGVQAVSASCPVEELSDEELTDLLGAATYLRDYCRGEQKERENHGN